MLCSYHREETPTIPPELQAAIDAGKEDEVKDMLAKVPDTWSKSLKKKLQKDAQIAAKKIAKGGAPAKKPAEGSAATGAAAPASKPAAAGAPGKATAAAAVPTGGRVSSAEGVVGASERTLVSELLACAESLGLSGDAMTKLREGEAALALSIAPTVNALRNEAYTLGYMCKAD
jgi:hypothetical protein